MDPHDNKFTENPRKSANLLSICTFKWLLGTFLTGYKRELEMSDLYSPLDEHSSKLLGDKVSHLWNQELEKYRKFKKPPSLVRVLLKCFRREIILFGLSLTFLELFIKMTRPIILVNLLRYFRGDHSSEISIVFYWSTALVLGMLLDIVIYHNAFLELGHVGMKIRIACIALMYRKVLKVPTVASEDNKCTTGQMINLLSNDAGKLDTMITQGPYMLIAPIHIIIISCLLYKEMKAASYGGIAVTLLFVFIDGFSGILINNFSWKLAYLTDERLRLTNQIISGIKVIKMYTWEKPFAYLNDEARKEEVSAIKNNGMTAETNFSYQEYIPRVSVFATILAYILLGNHIQAEKVYFVTAYYNVLRFSFYDCFSFGMKSLIEALVTIERIKIFLLSEEVKKIPLGNKINLRTEDNISLFFNNVTVKWNSGLEALKQVSFQLQSGSLTAIIGQVGAGKTVLFQTILREISDVQGEIKISGSIAYACQEPWLFNSSIKQNILFGKTMNRQRYDRVIEVCQLKRDFLLLPYGENTLIGEKGINLSGGQCARISLARAVYHEADIYLLDDPLSAVDTRVGKRIFEDCIKTFLKGKTILLITHQFQYLKQVDRIIALDQGSVLADGTYAELLDSGANLTTITQVGNEFDELNKGRSPAAEDMEIATVDKIEKEEKEGRTKDSVKSEIYLKYFKAAGSGRLVFLVFSISAVCQISRSGADGFVSYWVSDGAKTANFSFSSGGGHSHNWYITLYCFIIASSVLLSIIQAYTFFHMSMKISRNLHSAMFSSVIKTKMAFFTYNSVGRIMNRFSKDMGIVDTEVPRIILGIIQTTFQTIAIVGIVATIYPLFCIAVVIIATSTYLLSRFYLKTIRAVKRLDGITRSPVLNHLSTSVRGLTTIRALNAQQISIDEFNSYLDLNTSTSYIFQSGSRAFGMYIDLLCLAFTGIVTYSLVSLSDIISIGNAGLAITQCMLLAQTIQMNVRQGTDLESMMTSVERILEYSALEQEPLLERSPGHEVSEKWPQRGQIIFKDVSLIYDRQRKPFLRNLNFDIRPNEMIGIVGRTGAGKSSLINALFRLAEIKGEIYIDDVATSGIALQDLRSRISIIPQEPVLFAGTLRANLDPFGAYGDRALWQALEDVQLKALLQSSGLSARVAEGGMNFSVGQRQLLCLARAIVRNNRILVLDEATANVDPQTDQLIQKTVRRKFAECTVLIIAHRLHTVMDCSRILVMDAGQVVEFDHPYNLLQQESGIFYNMVKQLGATAAENLFQMARLNYEDYYGTYETSQFTI